MELNPLHHLLQGVIRRHPRFSREVGSGKGPGLPDVMRFLWYSLFFKQNKQSLSPGIIFFGFRGVQGPRASPAGTRQNPKEEIFQFTTGSSSTRPRIPEQPPHQPQPPPP